MSCLRYVCMFSHSGCVFALFFVVSSCSSMLPVYLDFPFLIVPSEFSNAWYISICKVLHFIFWYFYCLEGQIRLQLTTINDIFILGYIFLVPGYINILQNVPNVHIWSVWFVTTVDLSCFVCIARIWFKSSCTCPFWT